MTFAPPRGMRDFYPEDFRPREALFAVWRETAEAHGFEGYDASVVETEELLKRKGGEEIAQQIYGFADKSGRGLALRPEMTPTLARMIIARQGNLGFPLKWYAIAQCFRYERMSRGRKREHYQWNLDVVGEESIMAEAEVIGTAVDAMRRLGLTAGDFQVRVGSRALLGELFTAIGIGEEHFAASCLALDKRGKISDDETRELLRVEGLTDEAIHRVFQLLGIKTIDEAQGQLGEGSRAVAQMRELFAIAGDLGFADCLSFDVSVVRGLGYYTGIVFEGFDTAGKFRAIFGGGRYDNLLSSLGGRDCTAVGLGFGDVVIQELLAELGRLPGERRTVDCAVGFMGEDCRSLALRTTRALRDQGRGVELALQPESPKKFFKRADQIGALEAVFIGPDELAGGRIRIKDMSSREERELAL
jgi:histidyl-tRNA synthetase